MQNMDLNIFSLEGKRILVTGASSGIGRSAAQLFSKLGAKLVLIARNEERLRLTLESLDGDGHSIFMFDLTQTDDIPKLIKQIRQEQGPLSGLFHCAGIEKTVSVKMLNSKYIEPVFQSSIIAALMLTKGICQKGIIDKDSASIVFMSSVAGLNGTSGRSVYSASKAAVDGAMRSLACELADRGVRVNSIAAGAVQTEMMKKMMSELPEKSLDDFDKKHLLGFGMPTDIANAAAFLLSDAAKWITGTVMVVDGGYSCQ